MLANTKWFILQNMLLFIYLLSAQFQETESIGICKKQNTTNFQVPESMQLL
jgi:hypothetical protein